LNGRVYSRVAVEGVMRKFLATYKIPLIACLALLGLGVAWGVSSGRKLAEERRERFRRYSTSVGKAMEGIIDSLNRHAPYNLQHLRIMMEGIVKTTGLRFAGLVYGERTLVKAGPFPAGWHAEGERGEQTTEEVFISWHPIRLNRRLLAPGPGGSVDESATESAILVTGLPAAWKKEEYRRQIHALAFRTAGMLVGVAVLAVLWMLTIHTRTLAAELAMERMKRAHFEELGLAAAGLAHEAKNPLGIIRGLAQGIASDPAAGAAQRKTAEQIIDAVDRTSARLGEFMSYARFREPEIEAVNCRRMCEEVAGIMTQDFENAGVEISVEAAPVQVAADREMLQRILVNLLLNSLKASRPGSTVRIRTRSGKEGVSLSVEDDGEGIPPDLLPEVWKPYVSGRKEGHGLGLSIVKRIAERHGWTVSISSAEGKGTTVVIAGMKPMKGEGT